MYPCIHDIQVSTYPSIQKKSVSKISKYPDIKKKWYPLIPNLYLIDLQVQLGESKLAKKSFKKHFELFNLNSTNPNDVLLALKEERKKFVKQQTIWILEEISKKIQCGVRRDAELCRLC